MQRLGGDTSITANPPNADQGKYETNKSQDKESLKVVAEDKTSETLAPTRNVGIGRGVIKEPWQPGTGCMVDEKSPRKMREVSDQKADKIIKNIKDEQAHGLKQGLRLEKAWERPADRRGGWDMFSDQDQDPKVSFVSVMYQPLARVLFYGGV